MTTSRATAIQIVVLSNRIFTELAIHRHHWMTSRTLKQTGKPVLRGSSTVYWDLVERFNLTTLAVTLCKVMELHKAFREHWPESLRSRMDEINSDLTRRRIQELRNKHSGHILNDKTRRPLSDASLTELIEAFERGMSLIEIEQWFWPKDEPSKDFSIAGCLESVREYFMREFSISSEELQGEILG